MNNKIVPTPTKTDKAMEMIAKGKSIKQAAKAIGIRDMTFYRMMREDENFHRAYIEAKEQLADNMAHKAVKEAYKPLHENPAFANAQVQRSRLIISTLQWTAGKLKPRSWGDRVEVDVSGNVTISPLAQLRQLGASVDAVEVESETVDDDDCF